MTVQRLILLCSVLGLLSCTKDPLIFVIEDSITLSPILEPIPESEAEKKEWDATLQWLFAMQRPSGLLESSEHTNFVSLYDNALAAIYFIHLGERERAERILDFFLSQTQNELLAQPGGFFQFRNVEGQNGNRKWLGDNAWLLLALNQYEEAYGSSKYGEMQAQLSAWIRSLQDLDGGLFGGTNEDGSTIPKVTEGMITAFKAVQGYDHFHQRLLEYLHTNRWDNNEKVLLSWPENQAYRLALDVHTLGSAIFPELANDLLKEAHRFKTVQALTLTGEPIEGYCFDEDKDVVWLEGTAQMAVALKLAQRHAEADAILAQLDKAFIKSSSYPGAQGLPYASNPGTGYENEPLWAHADLAPALSATLWYLFAKEGFNPFGQGDIKEIPREDQFWSPILSN